ncbi:outer membrane protein assembly factor BamB family protein [Marinicrinis sediminis]|uniref:PQQ-binding-like beta-propeller repeat protein n=1 Tax=Marinicrinis sediminis TaxID=1652465 RepID=A0ABW5RDM8_9BACL
MRKVVVCWLIISSITLSGCWNQLKPDVKPPNGKSDAKASDTGTVVVPRPVEQWQFATGGAITSHPVVYDERVIFGSDDGTLYALSVHNGTEEWRYETDKPIRTKPLIVEDDVYVVGHDGILHVLHAKTGQLQWTFDTGEAQSEMDQWDYYDSSPLLAGDKIVFGHANRMVYAVHRENQNLVWSNRLEAPVKSTGVADQAHVYIGDWDGRVYALHVADGEISWTYKTQGNGRHKAIQANLTEHEGTLYVPARDFLIYALDAQTGTEKWKVTTPAWPASATILDGQLFSGNSNGFSMEALDIESGKEIWETSLSSNVLSAPLSHEGVLYVGTGYAYEGAPIPNHLYAMDSESGAELWKMPSNKIQSTPAIYGQLLLVGDMEGLFTGIRLPIEEPQSVVETATIYSEALGRNMQVEVYLPPEYDTEMQYPVLYMLYGYGGRKDSWFTNLGLDTAADELILSGEIEPMIIVSPDFANSFGVNADVKKGVLRGHSSGADEGLFEDYLLTEMIPYMDKTYATEANKEGRYIGGASMGGFAAMHLAFRHPELFSRVGGHSTSLWYKDSGDLASQKNWLFPTEEEWEARDPLHLAETADIADLQLFIDVGKGDLYASRNEELVRRLKAREIQVEWHLNPGGHSMTYWGDHVRDYLKFYGNRS